MKLFNNQLNQRLAQLCYYHAAAIVLAKKSEMKNEEDKQILEKLAKEIREKPATFYRFRDSGVSHQ
jgi:hypothetical protein